MTPPAPATTKSGTTPDLATQVATCHVQDLVIKNEIKPDPVVRKALEAEALALTVIDPDMAVLALNKSARFCSNTPPQVPGAIPPSSGSSSTAAPATVVTPKGLEFLDKIDLSGIDPKIALTLLNAVKTFIGSEGKPEDLAKLKTVLVAAYDLTKGLPKKSQLPEVAKLMDMIWDMHGSLFQAKPGLVKGNEKEVQKYLDAVKVFDDEFNARVAKTESRAQNDETKKMFADLPVRRLAMDQTVAELKKAMKQGLSQTPSAATSPVAPVPAQKTPQEIAAFEKGKKLAAYGLDHNSIDFFQDLGFGKSAGYGTPEEEASFREGVLEVLNQAKGAGGDMPAADQYDLGEIRELKEKVGNKEKVVDLTKPLTELQKKNDAGKHYDTGESLLKEAQKLAEGGKAEERAEALFSQALAHFKAADQLIPGTKPKYGKALCLDYLWRMKKVSSTTLQSAYQIAHDSAGDDEKFKELVKNSKIQISALAPSVKWEFALKALAVMKEKAAASDPAVNLGGGAGVAPVIKGPDRGPDGPGLGADDLPVKITDQPTWNGNTLDVGNFANAVETVKKGLFEEANFSGRKVSASAKVIIKDGRIQEIRFSNLQPNNDESRKLFGILASKLSVYKWTAEAEETRISIISIHKPVLQ